jgi:hypothetical protein
MAVANRDQWPFFYQWLSLSGGSIVNLGTMVTLCPRLCELRVTEARGNIKFHSGSLQKLSVSTDKWTGRHTHCRSIDILTPMLKELELVVQDNADISVSILAPTVEKVWWEPFSLGSALVFDFWSLGPLRLETAEDTCSPGVLGLYMSTSVRLLLYNLFNPCWSYPINSSDRYHVFTIFTNILYILFCRDMRVTRQSFPNRSRSFWLLTSLCWNCIFKKSSSIILEHS